MCFCIHCSFVFDKLGLKASKQKQERFECSFSLNITCYHNLHEFKAYNDEVEEITFKGQCGSLTPTSTVIF